VVLPTMSHQECVPAFAPCLCGSEVAKRINRFSSGTLKRRQAVC
jgi:hypothetical protein